MEAYLQLECSAVRCLMLVETSRTFMLESTLPLMVAYFVVILCYSFYFEALQVLSPSHLCCLTETPPL